MPLPLTRAALTVSAVLVAWGAEAAMPTVTPHRAVYDLQIDSARSKSSSDISGRLVFEATGTTCEGFTVNTRFVTRLVGDKQSVVNDLRSATWEAGDGSTYRFVTQNFVNQKLLQQTDGAATREDGTISVDLRVPEDAEFDLEAGILFPTQHVRRILEAAEAGEQIVVADVFDGSDTGRKSYATTTVIGARRPPSGSSGRTGDDVLGDLASWPVTVGYFEDGEGEPETPTYEFSYDLFENGVSRRIELGYGDFTLVGELAAIDFLQSAPCEE